MFAFISISHLPLICDQILQYTALVVVLAMLELFLLDLVAPEPPSWRAHFLVLVSIYVICVLVALVVPMPTDGLLANGVSAGRLRWVAIAGLTVLGTILIGSALGARWFGDPYKWSNQMVLRFYTVVFLLDIVTLYILWVLIG